MPTSARLRLAQHFRAMGDWLTVGYFESASDDTIAARDAMLADRHIEWGQEGVIRLYRLTDAGQAWLSEHLTD